MFFSFQVNKCLPTNMIASLTSQLRMKMRLNTRGMSLNMSTSSSANEARFIQQRSTYREELKSLRKEWAIEIEQRRAVEEKQAALEREKVVLARAVRLREKRKESVIRQEADKKAKLGADKKYREHLAKNLIVHNQRLNEQEKINARYMEELLEEQKTWITDENINDLITPSLFEGPASTGLLMSDSELWRWHLHSLKLDRLAQPDLHSSTDFGGSSLAERLQFRGQIRSTRKIMVQDFLEPLIESGADREKYDELVERFTTKFEELDVWHKADEVDDFFFDEDNTSATFNAMALDEARSRREDKVASEDDDEEEEGEVVTVKSSKGGKGGKGGRR